MSNLPDNDSVKAWDEAALVLQEYAFIEERMRYSATLKPLMSLDRDSRILEVGCGVGRMLRALYSMGFHNLSATEISKQRLKTVEELGPSGIELHHSDKVPVEESAYDAVISSAVIEHVKSPAEMLQAISRTLRPGGLLSITTDTYMWRWLQKLGLYVSDQPLDRAIWPREMERWANEAGLVLTHCGSFINTPNQRWFFLRQISTGWLLKLCSQVARRLGHQRRRTPATGTEERISPEQECKLITDGMDHISTNRALHVSQCIWGYECFYWFERSK